MTKFLHSGKLWMMGILLLIAVTAAPALAGTITITNPSFEADFLTNGDWNYSVAGWILSGSGGTWNPGGYYPGSVPNGANVAWTQDASLSQTLSDIIQAGYHYTLAAYVGKFSTAAVNYYIQLVAEESGAILASATGDASTLIFNQISAEFTATNQYLGQHLKVVIGNHELTETDFDSITLTSSAVPLPSTLILLGSSLLGLMGWRRMSQI
jgi:hypothetical protein